MNKELVYKGYTAAPSDNVCEDGELSVMMDVFPENSVIRPSQQPYQYPGLVLEENDRILYRHKVSEDDIRFLGTDGSQVIVFHKPDGTDAYVRETIPDTAGVNVIDLIGNTFVMDDLTYMLFKKGESTIQEQYKYLGSLADAVKHFTISFGLKSEFVGTDWEYGEQAERHIEFSDALEKGEGESQFKPIDPRYWKFSEDDRENVSKQLVPHINKFIKKCATDKGKFIYPFLLRYAFRLYDGSLVMHSAPILMQCSSYWAPYIHLGEEPPATWRREFDFELAAFVCSLDYRVRNLSGDLSLAIKKWSDVIKSVDIFITDPLYLYDQNGLIDNTYMLGVESGDGISCFDSGTPWPGAEYVYSVSKNKYNGNKYAPAYLQEAIVEKYSKGSNPNLWYTITPPIPSYETVRQKIEDASRFYFLKSISIEDLNDYNVHDIEVPSDYLGSLVNRELMTDDYYSQSATHFKRTYVYNNRINLCGITKSPYVPDNIHQFLMYTEGTSHYDAAVTVRKSGELVLMNDLIKYGALQAKWQTPKDDNDTYCGLYFFYPDTGATELKWNDSYTWYSLPFKSHGFLNGAVYFAGWRGPGKDSRAEKISPPSETDKVNKDWSELNKIYTSEVANPFAFLPTNINTIGIGEVLALASNARPVSQGQFGAYPMFAFTTEGVWALEVNSATGGWSGKQPISQDVCTNPDAIAQLDSEVLFVTARGIMMIAGSQVVCMSELIDEKQDSIFTIEQLPNAVKILAGLDGDKLPDGNVFKTLPFQEFLNGKKERQAAVCHFKERAFKHSISIFPTSKEVNHGQGTFDISVKSDGQWTVGSSSPYLSFNKFGGYGDGEIRVTYQAVAEGFSANIVFTVDGGATANCIFKENANDPKDNYLQANINVANDGIRIQASYPVASTIRITIQAKVEAQGGYETRSIWGDIRTGSSTATLRENLGPSEHIVSLTGSGSISPVSDENYNYHLIISNDIVNEDNEIAETRPFADPIVPEEQGISIDPVIKEVDYGSGSFPIVVTTKGKWSVSSTSPHLRLDRKEGVGSAVVTATYDAVTDGFSADIVFESEPTGCGILYDYPKQRVLFFNPNVSYAYAYSFQMKAWSMISDQVVAAVRSYPNAVAVVRTPDGKQQVVDYSEHLANETPRNQVIVTRPLKLDAPDVMKTISSIIQRGKFAAGPGKLITLLWGSRNLEHWLPVSSSTDKFLRGISGTAFKYFRIGLKMQFADDENITSASIEYDVKENNQPR